jgi:hypothetical protein
MVGQFGSWTPIGAEQTASGYDLAWKMPGADSYGVWATNSSGAYTSTILNPMSGSSSALESLESVFHQDLNSDGVIGLNLPTTVIEAVGSTSLVQVGSNYFLYPVGGSSGPELSSGGMPVTVGQFGSWTPIGAEQTASGYDIAWKMTGADSYGVWATNSSGAYTSNILNPMSGSSSALESLEPVFHQDLNSDGVIGLPTTVIEAFGSTSLVQVGNNYFFYPVGGSSGPELSYNGMPVMVGQFGSWTPIGAEQTASGYDLAWKMPGADSYGVWATNSSGAYTSTILNPVSGTSSALESLEPVFHQDLNSDGVIGLPTTVIEAFGSTSLVQVGNNYFFYPVGGSSGPELSYNGMPVMAGQFGSWTPIGAEQTASGYDLAWKMPGADSYGVWATNSSGAYTSTILNPASGSSSALKSFEPVFHQDLNGDGSVGGPTPPASAAAQSNTTIDAGTTLELSSAYNGAVTFAASTGTLQLDQSSSFSGTVAGMSGQDTLDLRDINSATVQTPTFSGNSSGGTLSVTDGTHSANIALLGNYLASTFVASSDGHGGTSVVDLPAASVDQNAPLSPPQHA